MKKYKHFISLGYFCSVAEELERIGLRSCSSPFDWCISDWKGVQAAINNHFEGYLEYDKLFQNSKDGSIYKNAYNIEFFHDFSEYKTLKKQLDFVKDKYDKRIERFYKNINEPTLFIRYISTEQGLNELIYIEENYLKIIEELRFFNKDNDIIFISNYGISSDKINLYLVEKDENDNVARRFLDKNNELFIMLNSFEYTEKSNNIKLYEKKKNNNKVKRMKYKMEKTIKKYFFKEYIHGYQY